MTTLLRSRRSLRIFAMLAVTLGALGGWSRALSAQFTIDELELHFTPDGSGSMTGVIPIHSSLDSLQQLRIVLNDWERDSTGANRFVEHGSLPSSCKGRIEVFPATVQLAPRATEFVRVTFTGRQLPDPGCWSAVSVERVRPPTELPEGPSVTLSLVIAVKVYVHATGASANGEVVSADVEDIWIRRPPVGTGAPDSVPGRQVAVRFANTGTSHLRVKTTLEVRTQTTELVQRIDGPEAYITPGNFRDILIQLPALQPGRYAAIVLLDYGAEEITAAQVEFEVP